MMILPYVLLTLIIMLPLLASGFILTLDMVFVPHPPLPTEVTSSYLFHAVLHFLSYVIPGDVLQKFILVGTLLMAGIGMHKLVESLKVHVQYSTIQWGAYFAGLFYVVNPFVYGRFMAGQYAVLLGYALLPFFVRALLKFIAKPALHSMIPLIAYTITISILSIHTLGLIGIATLVALSAGLWQYRHKKGYAVDIFKFGALGSLAAVVLSSYWLVPTLLGHSRIAESVNSFGVADRQAFATDDGLLSVLQLQGFWVEAQGLFTPHGEPLPLSGFWQLLLFTIISIGIVRAWRHQRALALTFGTIGAIAALLATGGQLNQWLVEHVPLFAGYREPHKFTALLALVYAVFSAFGVGVIVSRARSWKWVEYGALVLFTLPLLITPTMVWGFNGQLKPVQYPADWYAVDRKIGLLSKGDKVLFLPWHLYMKYSFTDRIIASPADKFFNAPIIESNDPEFAGVIPPYDMTKAKLSNEILPHAKINTHLGATLKQLNIRYILLAKETDYESYAYLDKQPDIVLVIDTPTLKLYRNTAMEGQGNANN